MISLNICGKRTRFKNVSKEDISELLNWYNNIDDFKYATGVDKLLTIEEMSQKFAETALSSYDFFSWIMDRTGEKIGIIKGSFRYKEKDSVWINSILIDACNRRKGYGKDAVEALLSYSKDHFGLNKVYISVIEENKEGVCFWKSLGLKEFKRMEKHIELNSEKMNVIIMYRQD